MITVEAFLDAMYKELVKDHWGTIEPEDFAEGGEYSEDMKKLIEKVLNKLQS